jgi:hypothetical protein
MTLYELIFILLFLSSVIAAFGILILIGTRRRSAARKILLGAGTIWCVYFVLLAASDLITKPLVIAPGQDRCFDEMCFAVVNAQTSTSSTTSSADRKLYAVTVRVTSHSRGRTQGEGGLRARLYDHGQFFDISTQAQKEYELEHGRSPVLTQRLSPGESIQSVLIFDVPNSITQPSLTLDHGFTPGYFVIGESPFFHGPDLLKLPQY